MVKFFGVIFLGQPREDNHLQSQRASTWERVGMVWLALGCVALGLAPVQFIALIDPVTRQLISTGMAGTVSASGWLLVPVDIDRASYGPVVFLLGLAASFALAFLLVRKLYHGRLRRAAPWDCGYPWQNARMQDTAEGFGQPIRQIFEPFFRMQRELPSPFDREPRYRVVVGDHFWHWLYQPVADLVERLSRWIGQLQQGRIAVLPRGAVHRLQLHAAGERDHPDALDRPAARPGCRRDRPGRAVRARARLHVAGGDGCRHVVRDDGRASRDADRFPRRARPPDGAVLGVADPQVDLAREDRRDHCPARPGDLPEPRLGRRRLHHALARRDRARADRPPGDSPRADDDPRGAHPRVLGSAPGPARMGSEPEAVRLLVPRPGALPPVGC